MQTLEEMHVIKRSGQAEIVSFDKILQRVKKVGQEVIPPLNVKYSQLVMKVIDQLYDNIPTSVIDELTAEQCAAMSTKPGDYGALANRIIVSNHHKNTRASFSETMRLLYKGNNESLHVHRSLISSQLWARVEENAALYDGMIDHSRDYLFDYFGFKTLERAYLMKLHGKVVERPQHMWMRVVLGIHGTNTAMVKEVYDLMSQKYFTHATPTLFNAGTPRPQLSSCFLMEMESDSVDGIYNTLKECATISKWAGGIGLHIHNVRATGSHIQGTNGTSNGIVPMLRVFNNTARYIDQGGGKRNGSFAIYLEPWHADIEDFLMLKRNHGNEDMRARDLFYALWIPDLFMDMVRDDKEWALFCPHTCPGLADCYGDTFVALYNKYKDAGKASKIIKARELWYRMLDSQMETGTPYMLYKDAANKKSNQKNVGTIKSSNLCTEIIEYTNPQQTAVCNLASIALNMFVDPATKTFNYEELHRVTRVVTYSLNQVIDGTYYPIQKSRNSNQSNRPIGIGVQGLADTFALMDIAFYSEEAKQVNKNIFETMYHAALEQSMEMAKVLFQITLLQETEYSTPTTQVFKHDAFFGSEYNIRDYAGYINFNGSPASQGLLQYDLWDATATHETTRYDWPTLKSDIMQYGLRNSLLLAPMPTASTSQILGNNECFEPFTSNIYTRRTNAGEFIMVNKHLLQELTGLGLWSEELKDNIILNKGSVQQLEGLSQKIKDKYRTVWEIPMQHLIDMSADRGPYICQSQSLNLWVEDPDYNKLTSMYFYSWQKGLKTGLYYLRRKPKHQPQQFTIRPQTAEPQTADQQTAEPQTAEPQTCDMCSS